MPDFVRMSAALSKFNVFYYFFPQISRDSYLWFDLTSLKLLVFWPFRIMILMTIGTYQFSVNIVVDGVFPSFFFVKVNCMCMGLGGMVGWVGEIARGDVSYGSETV